MSTNNLDIDINKLVIVLRGLDLAFKKKTFEKKEVDVFFPAWNDVSSGVEKFLRARQMQNFYKESQLPMAPPSVPSVPQFVQKPQLSQSPQSPQSPQQHSLPEIKEVDEEEVKEEMKEEMKEEKEEEDVIEIPK